MSLGSRRYATISSQRFFPPERSRSPRLLAVSHLNHAPAKQPTSWLQNRHQPRSNPVQANVSVRRVHLALEINLHDLGKPYDPYRRYKNSSSILPRPHRLCRDSIILEPIFP